MNRREVDALHVHRVDAVELGLGDLEVRLVAVGPAGVVDDDVELGARAGDQLCPVAALGDIGMRKFSAHLPGDALAGLHIDVGDDDLGAFLGEALRDARAEPRAGPGDDGGLALEPHLSSLNGLCSHSSSTYRVMPAPSRCRKSSTARANLECASQCAEGASTGSRPRKILCSPCAPPSNTSRRWRMA